MKAQLIAAVAHAAQEHGLTHVELAKRSGLPRSAVTGILSGSLQKVMMKGKSFSGNYVDLFTNEKIRFNDGQVITMKPWEYRVSYIK